MVTISTRVARHAELLAITERFPDVYCSVGTHPHNAHEELDVTHGRSRCAARVRPKSSRSARPVSTITTTTRRATRRSAAFAAISRRRARPACRWSSISREADDDTARILEEETGKGAFPAVLHCFTGGRELARPRDRARAFHLVHRHPDVQEFGGAARDRRRAAGRPHSGRDRRALSRARQISRQAQRAGLCGRDRKSPGRNPRRFVRRDRAADHGEFLSPVQQSAAARGCAA